MKYYYNSEKKLMVFLLWIFFSDDLANNLYWTDVERGTIEVYSFITQQRAVVKQFVGIETPIALVAIPED